MKNIGIIIPSSSSGGVFQCALSIAESVIDYSDRFTYSLIHFDSENLTSSFKLKNIRQIIIPQKVISLPRKIVHFLGLFFGIKRMLFKNIDSVLENAGVDFLIIPTPFSLNVPLRIPYIVFIPDLMHRYYHSFPEYGIKERISRDIVYGYYARNASLNIVESEQGADDLRKFFRIERRKIHIIPVMPPGYIYDYKEMNTETAGAILKKYKLPENFLFYPAQFWHHKNHLNLIRAIDVIKKRYGIKIPLVLVGNSGGHYEKIYNKVIAETKKLQIADQIIHLGYVSNKEIVALYKKSLGLIFPSLIGPTSIPPIEAMVLGVPLACSNLFEMPKQVGDAGLLFDPFDVSDMAEKIYQLWTSAKLRIELRERGYARIKNITPEHFTKKWEEAIENVFN